MSTMHPQKTCATPATTDTNATWYTPSSDLVQVDGGFELAVELPGVTPEALELEIDDRTLTVKGAPRHGDHGRRFHQELHGVTFLRRFTLGRDIATDAIEAQLTDGVLRVRLPLREETRPRKIAVDVRS